MGSLKIKPHAVLLPYPAQGFHITFVNTEFNHRRLLQSNGLNFVKAVIDFRFETVPDGLPSSDKDATQDIWALSDSVQKNCPIPFRELLRKLNSSPELPPVSCIISDGLMSFAIEAAHEFGIPEVQFWTASAIGLIGFLHFDELIKRGIVPFKDDNFMNDGSLEMPLDWIEGVENIRLKDMPTLIRTTDPKDIMLNFMSNEAQNCLKSSAIIFNTFAELEHPSPLSLLEKHLPPLPVAKSLKSNLWKEDFKCLEWLDKQESQSVLYVNYGSITVMSEDQFQEFAWGLANSKPHFCGLLGLNSTLESVCNGVPMLCWPFFDEQPMNCRYSCTKWGIGMEINHDVKRSEIQRLVEEIMEGEKGKKMKINALEWKKKAESYKNWRIILY
uniref:Anthocyanidin 3-O-glucosyltransferase n=1 Tax=Manihot esculenta TaxID=3983 RepID=A0A2C9URJ0_MANES